MKYDVPHNTQIVEITGLIGAFVKTKALAGNNGQTEFTTDLTPGAVYRLTTLTPGRTWGIKFIHVATDGKSVAEVTEDQVRQITQERDDEQGQTIHDGQPPGLLRRDATLPRSAANQVGPG